MNKIETLLTNIGIDFSNMTKEDKFIIASKLTFFNQTLYENDWNIPGGVLAAYADEQQKIERPIIEETNTELTEEELEFINYWLNKIDFNKDGMIDTCDLYLIPLIYIGKEFSEYEQESLTFNGMCLDFSGGEERGEAPMPDDKIDLADYVYISNLINKFKVIESSRIDTTFINTNNIGNNIYSCYKKLGHYPTAKEFNIYMKSN